jgi:HEAT repeat protein
MPLLAVLAALAQEPRLATPGLDRVEPALAVSLVAMPALAVHLDAAGSTLAALQLRLAALAPSLAWQAPQDTAADSLYRAARRLLNRGRYADATAAFQDLIKRYPQSTRAGDAHYWAAFGLYRAGETAQLQSALGLLGQQRERYPQAATRRDAETLAVRIDGELARRGDADAARRVATRAEAAAVRGAVPARPPLPARPPRPPRPGQPARDVSCANEDDDIPTAALNALLQMDPERALPILKNVLARRDTGSVCLRRRAIFLVSQKRSPETDDILLAAARSDPDSEVREQAVFWLSQVPTEEAALALDSILRSTHDPVLQDKAIFALSQHRSARAGAALRSYAERSDVPPEIREKAIFWLSQHRSAENAAFLRGLFARLDNDELKDKVLFSLSQMRGQGNERWLLDVAGNERESLEIRKKALFWAGQSGAPLTDLVALYDRTRDTEMREQLIFVYAQRREPAALDQLFTIARREPDQELRKKAIFWIGQSRDPRAAQVLADLINQ